MLSQGIIKAQKKSLTGVTGYTVLINWLKTFDCTCGKDLKESRSRFSILIGNPSLSLPRSKLKKKHADHS